MLFFAKLCVVTITRKLFQGTVVILMIKARKALNSRPGLNSLDLYFQT